MKSFSTRNLYAMTQWYKFYASKYQFLPHHVAQIPRGHNRLIISKVKDIEEAEFYVVETTKNARDRDTLEVQIKNNYYLKLGNSANNFTITLSNPQSQLANQTIKDPYNFDFLGLEQDALELAVENELTKHITKFLLELGKGFAFIGRQYKIEI
jgi:predicted nuclease of restriction endonuclease-like (RecB) superfamily